MDTTISGDNMHSSLKVGVLDAPSCPNMPCTAGHFSNEQKAAAHSILDHYTNGTNWVILLAQMQSGKTDTYMLVAFELLRRNMVQRVVIMAGFQDKELVEQLRDITPSLAMYAQYMEHDLRMPHEERAQTVSAFRKRFHILCGADLHNTSLRARSDVLFIWDESHYAQNTNNRPFHFLQSVGVSADGETREGRRFLSVSATPFSEVCDAIHEKQPKQIVRMEPGDGYVSVGFLYRNGNLRPVEHWVKDLTTQLQQQRANPTPSYSIVRIRGDKEIARAVEIAVSSGLDYEIYDAQHKQETRRTSDSTKMQSFMALAARPVRHKVVFIRGMLRMGKRIPKDHISFVMETSTLAKTDVLLQGLIGRMCGYHSNTDVRVFVSPHLFRRGNDGINEVERYIQMMDSTRRVTLVPRRATNLAGVYGAKSKKDASARWYYTHPIVLPPARRHRDDDEAADPDHELYAKERLVARFKTALPGGPDSTLHNSNGIEQMTELLEQIRTLPSESWNIHHLTKPSGAVNSTYADIPMLMQCALERRAALTVPAGCGFGTNDHAILNVWSFNTHQFARMGFPKGTLVLHGRTRTTSDAERVQMEIARNIPSTTKSEVFTRDVQRRRAPAPTATTPRCDFTVDGSGTCTPAIVIGDKVHRPDDVSADDPWNNTESMRRYLDRLVGLSRTGSAPTAVTLSVPGSAEPTGIVLDAAVLLQLDKNGDIFHYIKAKYNQRLHICKQRGRQPQHLRGTGKVRIQKIEWKSL
jgi:hypothetical protein